MYMYVYIVSGGAYSCSVGVYNTYCLDATFEIYSTIYIICVHVVCVFVQLGYKDLAVVYSLAALVDIHSILCFIS